MGLLERGIDIVITIDWVQPRHALRLYDLSLLTFLSPLKRHLSTFLQPYTLLYNQSLLIQCRKCLHTHSLNFPSGKAQTAKALIVPEFH